MSWFLFALIGHLSNGAAFIIDKILLHSAFKQSATYAGLVGTLSFIVIVAAPWVTQWPQGAQWVIAGLSGVTFIIALWAFFEALARAEASRIVPVIGSLIPILTLVGSFFFLNERLHDQTILGFCILILATILLSGSGKGKLNKKTIFISILSAFFFAVASITGKVAYDQIGFLGGFLTTRIAAAMTAILVLFIFDQAAGKEFLSIIKPGKKTKPKSKQKYATLLTCIGQSLGAIGFLFVQIAIARGSATIVNAMQTIQYALLVIVGISLYKKAPQLLNEELSRKTLVFKTTALILTAIGMALIV
ncbi:EamA family transporter [Candidatus Uhrbacteria bacterium]|nr:EamA family transporter [Candidatus Uhrbacteria bacterium]